ncbi:MAG: hypothetical protein R8P61_36950 [Bacteroidia bacterium]|nr:hypothetical protein [Bacteroidia bacterium]
MKKIPIKALSAIIISLLSLGFIGETNRSEAVELRWKLKEGDTLTYETSMVEMDSSTFNFNIDEIFGNASDSSDSEANEFFEKFKNFYTNTNIITRLTHSQHFEDVLAIEMLAIPKKKVTEKEEEKDQFMNAMLRGTMLRGSVHPSGELHSFWVQSKQKNLISIFFELPPGKVSAGDSWSLNNVNLIGNDQNFVCEEANKSNQVRLREIKSVEGESIAVLDYDILEYVSGQFNSPFGAKNKGKKTIMKFVYKAQAEFSIDKGKWISYQGIMSLDVQGIMNSKQRQKFALVEK